MMTTDAMWTTRETTTRTICWRDAHWKKDNDTIENKCRCDVPVYCRDLLSCLTLSDIDLPSGVVGQDSGKTWKRRSHIKELSVNGVHTREIWKTFFLLLLLS